MTGPLTAILAIVSLRETNGLAIAVPDEEIISVTKDLSGIEAIYAEPSSATPLAALKQLLASKVVEKDESVALIVTGFGLNQPDATVENSPPPTNLSGLGVDSFDVFLTESIMT